MAPSKSILLPQVVRVVAPIVFAFSAILALSSNAFIVCIITMLICGFAWGWAIRTINRRRVDQMYALLSRIGDGELGASLEDSNDELTLRMQRGIARAQRGYAEALAQAEIERDELQSLLGAIQTGLISLDAHLRVRSANEVAEKMLGLESLEYRGRLLAEVIRQPELLRFAEESLSASIPTTREIKLSGGSVESIFVVADPLKDSSGTPDGVLLALDDFTKIRRLENVRTDFAANVSHELRTPITNIKGYLETLMQVGADDQEQVKHFLGVMHRNTIRLSTLVEDILLLAFLDQPKAISQLDFASIDVLSVVRDATEQVEIVCTAKQMVLELKIDPTLRFVVNAGLLSQAILNLVSNALKYSPPSTRVLLCAELDDGHIELRVIDEGPGIDALHLPRLFERFYRVDTARSRELGGTGLGLSIVKHIAMIHGGTVSVNCPKEGGTVFLMRIPKGYR
ncbi:MAG: ATP-binding protein [Planctomycetota bacterium]|nr:ATP-binding protein [Planctomycetota bacterium]MDA1261568.1 ATP-binding protein [Planctomycetota bacterium]